MAFVQSSSCFVAIPFSSRYEGVNRAVTETLGEFNITRVDGMSQSAAGPSVINISGKVERADFVIADVTDGSPNVFYELGVADGLRKPALIMTQRKEKLPVELVGRQVIVYGPGDFSKLTDYLRYWIPEAISFPVSRTATGR